MPGEYSVWTETFKAAGDLSTYQNRFVKLSAANTVTVCGAQEKAIGVLKNAPNAAGKPARVQILGICQVDADGDATDIVAGDWIISAADGIAVSGAVAKDPIVGQANEALTVAGPLLIEVLLTGPKTLSV